MVGSILISSIGVPRREEQSLCFRSSKVIALEATLVKTGSCWSKGTFSRQTEAPSCLT